MLSSFQPGGGDVELESESDSPPTHTKSVSPIFVLSLFHNMQKAEAFVIFCFSEEEPTNLYFITQKNYCCIPLTTIPMSIQPLIIACECVRTSYSLLPYAACNPCRFSNCIQYVLGVPTIVNLQIWERGCKRKCKV